MRGEEELEAVTTEEQREELLTELDAGEDWLYMDGEGANATEYKEHLAKLKAKGDPMFERAVEAKTRPAALEAAKKFIDITRQVRKEKPAPDPPGARQSRRCDVTVTEALPACCTNTEDPRAPFLPSVIRKVRLAFRFASSSG